MTSPVHTLACALLVLAASSSTAAAQAGAPSPVAAAAVDNEARAIHAQAVAAAVFAPDARPSSATRASSPERWGLHAPDFSLTFDEALMAKAGLPARWKEVQAAAKRGDAYAQTLAGIYLRLPMGGEDQKAAQAFFAQAAKQGLVRAHGEAMSYAWNASESEEEDDALVGRVRALENSDNAHVRCLYALLVMREDFGASMRALGYSARAGYAPAVLMTARLMIAQGKADPRQAWAKAGPLVERAAAAGLPAAVELLKERPAP